MQAIAARSTINHRLFIILIYNVTTAEKVVSTVFSPFADSRVRHLIEQGTVGGSMNGKNPDLMIK
jgi:hypothetical protein